MAVETRKTSSQGGESSLGNGPMLAKVVSHLDASFMGGLEVTLLRDQGNMVGDENQSYTVRYMSPFFGSSAFEFMGTNKSNAEAYNDTQKSYGMWFTPPDIGVTVMVVFIDGDPSEGYWMGCVPGKFINHMIPAIAGTDMHDATDAEKKKYNTKQPLPVAEINRKNNSQDTSTAIDKVKKPVHPIADVFLTQGLIEDDVRGVTTSSVRRDVPNMVFGILTPGPLDKRDGAKKAFIGRKQSKTEKPVPVSRLGGTQLVFDDGDDRYQRKKPAKDGPVEYADVLKGEKGDPTIPYNEYFRIRTRTGHQLLMHNSEDLIYIGNSTGTTWIELTGNGKIDIYAEDSVSIHTKTDFNFRADRDVNIEAGRNINMRSEKGWMRADVAKNFEIIAGANSLITTTGSLDINTAGNTKISSTGSWDLQCDGSLKLKTNSTLDLKSSADFKITSGAKLHLNSSGNLNLAAGADLNLKASSKWMQSGSSYWTKPSGGGGSSEVSEVAATSSDAAAAIKLEKLSLHKNIVTDGTTDWAKTKYQKGTLESIMKRIPMHEPWALHENMAPSFVGPKSTDRETE